MCFKKKPHRLLNCLTNPQISHRWGSVARNLPLVPKDDTPIGSRPDFDTFTRVVPMLYKLYSSQIFKESMRDSFYIKNDDTPSRRASNPNLLDILTNTLLNSV